MPEREGRVLSTDRIESFSDAILAIILTLLVLDLLPDRAEAPVQYLRDWPEHLAYLIAFLTIGSIWITTTPSSPGSGGRTAASSSSTC